MVDGLGQHERGGTPDRGAPHSTAATMVLARPRLEDLLDRWTTAPVVVVEGPAGVGKTTLAQAWATRAHGHGGRPRWLGVDDRPEGRAGRRPAAGARSLAAPEIRVLDDVRDLRSEAVTAWAEAASHEPQSLRLVLTTRRTAKDLATPGPDAEAVRVVHALDLAFTPGEAQDVVRSHWPQATAHDVQLLQHSTWGWASLLVLAADRLAGRTVNGEGLIPFLLDDAAIRGLMAESVRPVPDGARAVLAALARTGMVEPWTTQVAREHSDARPLLASLARQGLIARASRGGHPGRWNVHPILLEYLRQRVELSSVPRRGRPPRHAGARRPHDDPVAGVEEALAAGRTDVLVDAVSSYGPGLLWLGRADLLTRCQHAVPRSERLHNASLLAVEALRLRDADDVDGALAAARAALQGASDASRLDLLAGPDVRLSADLALLGLWQARFGWADPARAITVATQVLEADSSAEHPQLSVVRRGWLALELGATLLSSGEVAEALVHLERAHVLVRGTDYGRLRAAALAHLSFAELVDGAFKEASSDAEEALDLAAATGRGADGYVPAAELALAWVAFYGLEPSTARRHLEAVEAHEPEALDPLVLTMSRLLHVRLHVEQDGYDDAWQTLIGGTVARQTLPAFLWRALLVARAEVHIASADRTGLQADVHELRLRGEEHDADLFHAIEMLLRGDADHGRAALKALVEQPVCHATTGLAAAACYVAVVPAGDDGEARRALRDLLDRVWQTGAAHFLLLAVSAGPRVLALLQEEAGAPAGHPYAREALDRVTSGMAAGRSSGDKSFFRAAGEAVVQAGVEVTPRELAVLKGLARGMSYLEIGQSLYITPNTVKTHVQSLYRKLDVDRAAHAVLVARERGLLPEQR